MAGEVTLLVAFAAGVASFFTPCLVPIVPGYLAFVTGGGRDDAEAANATARAVARQERIVRTAAFVLGFGLAFTALGLSFGALGTVAGAALGQEVVQRLAGAFIVLFGLVMLDLVRLPFLDRDLRYHGDAPDWAGPNAAALLLGGAFGLGWSACAGPILGSILVLAGLEGGIAASAGLLAVYSAGLAVPFLVLGLTADRGAAWLRRVAPRTHLIETVGGIALIALGIAIFTGAAQRITSLLV